MMVKLLIVLGLLTMGVVTITISRPHNQESPPVEQVLTLSSPSPGPTPTPALTSITTISPTILPTSMPTATFSPSSNSSSIQNYSFTGCQTTNMTVSVATGTLAYSGSSEGYLEIKHGSTIIFNRALTSGSAQLQVEPGDYQINLDTSKSTDCPTWTFKTS